MYNSFARIAGSIELLIKLCV